MKIFKARLIFISILLMLCFCVLIGRLFYIQILYGNKYAIRCREQSKLRTLVSASRGCIKDRRGHILAKSVSCRVPVRDIVSNDEHDKGMHDISIKRIYPYGDIAGPVLGYIGTDGNGLAGVEYAFDNYLRGENGWSIVQKDGRNKRYSRLGMPKKVPQNGCDVYLTIDIEIQKIAERVLTEKVRKYKAKGGMCIILDPESGDVLAMVNVPSFNPNIWRHYSSEQRVNRCISYNYEPGSTFKVITAAATLQEGVKEENDKIDGNQGVYEIYEQTIHDYKPFGVLTFAEALCYSSNVCFAKIASELGKNRLYKYTRDFGLGANSGVLLPGEETGIVHPVNKWSGRTLVTMAMGYEVSVTLLQMVVAFSAVANGGILIEPHIYRIIVNAEGNTVEERVLKAKRRIISEDIARRLRAMMQGVVEYGTARRCALPGLLIGGKTGTSKKIDPETGTYSDEKVWASFIGFAPVEKPALVCGIVIDEPLNGGGGGAVAAPAFKQIVHQIISHPDLAFAEKLIRTNQADSIAGPIKNLMTESDQKIPDLCGMDRSQVSRFCTAEKIPFEVIGTGRRIAFQSPPGGMPYGPAARLILYTSEDEQSTEKRADTHESVRIPNCVGKDLRDAVNALNLKGLVPYVKGSGVVRQQAPAVGVVVQSTEICTLVCSFEG